ncbi:hypothetical protein P1X15_12050 [Runella sp. MFBS21]|uniref:hypothetical protein n=1 Tax=Runella sp. MFBS21 TaxID=3034018 RepID=UPI0023F68605|nr:hypothetical protein [Runella sp. MFBS21]MDF7818337.1 hypothetical protein [Runella sp. MFBS21]
MIFLFDIIFQSGEFSGDDNSFWTDLLVGILGAGVGAYTTIWVYLQSLKKEKLKEEIKKKEFEKDKLRYLQHLINKSLSTIEHLITGLDKFIQTIEEDNITFPELISASLHDLERIVHRINQEEHYHSYLNQLKNDDIAVIFGIIDYFYDSYNEIRKSLEKSQKFDFDRKQEYTKLVYEVRKMVASKLGELKKDKNPYLDFYETLNRLLVKHINETKQNPTNLELIQKNLIQPLLELWKDNKEMSQEIDFDEIVNNVSNANKMLFPIKENNKSVAIDLQDYSNDFKKNLEILKEKYKPLNSFIENLSQK